MANDFTLHVKIPGEMDKKLKRLAYTRGMSKGQLVREAITTCYQTAMEELPIHQKQALSAYQGGYISLGKLAEVMGMHVLVLRRWLNDRGISPQSVYGGNDVRNARG